jgi:pimeloyl-ACP methyl ester carboxylesterase
MLLGRTRTTMSWALWCRFACPASTSGEARDDPNAAHPVRSHHNASSGPPAPHRRVDDMRFIFGDDAFSFETLRATGYACYGGADIGEVLMITRKIPERDELAWHREWKAGAEHLEQLAQQSLDAGNPVSARHSLLRASNYYRCAEYFRRDDPSNDSEVVSLCRRSRSAFLAAMRLSDHGFEQIEIPYEGLTLPGYLHTVDHSGRARPTLIVTASLDSTLEESYFAIAAAALARGYNVLAYDGPGQGSALRESCLMFRPDWEAVVTPVIDYAISRPELSSHQLIAFGYSLGAYLAARAAAFDPRMAALILDDGICDFRAAVERVLPPFLLEWIQRRRDSTANPVLSLHMSADIRFNWAMRHGMWSMGASTPADLTRAFLSYSLTDIADRIRTPTLVLDAENDQFLHGQALLAARAIGDTWATLATLTIDEGAGEHCHMGAMPRAHQVIFDWLGGVVAPSHHGEPPAPETPRSKVTSTPTNSA